MSKNDAAVPRTMSIDEACKEIGISRSLGYDLAKKGEMPGMIKVGKRILISRAALDRLLS